MKDGSRTCTGLPGRSIARAIACAFASLAIHASAQTPAPDSLQTPVDTPVELRFDIERFIVEGNTLLPQSEVNRIVQGFLGPQRDFGDVQRALEALELAYRARGFAAVQVYLPEQEMEKGTIRLRVIEARVRKLEIEGNKFFSDANVRASLPSLAQGRTPNANEVARNLRIVNESPAKQTNVTLRAGEAEGEVDAIVEVTDEKPTRFFMTLDDTGTGATGIHRLGFGYQHANLNGFDHQLTLQYVTSVQKPKRVGIYSVGYHVPFYAQGGSLDVFAGVSDVDAGSTQTTAGTLSFSGAGTVMGARYNRHLERIGAYEHRLVFGIDYRDYRNTCSLGTFGAAGCGTAAASFTLFPASLTYAGNLSQANGQTSFYATAITNLPLNVDSDTTALGRARFAAKANYWIYRAGITYAHSFEGDWQGRVRLDGQYTEDVLTPPDQFGIGGANSVRGFQERERADDRGHSASLEVYTPDLAPRLGLGGWSMRVIGFYDVGRTRRVDPLPGEVVHNGIASFGTGLRVALGKTFTLRTDLAHILDPGGTRERGHWRAGFAATLSF